MLRSFKSWRLLSIIGSVLFFAAGAAGQTPRYNSVPTGHQPLGVAASLNQNGNGQRYAVVANSGDNSVSIFQLNLGSQGIALSLSATVTGIPSPYAVADCGNGTVLVTSPSDNSVRLIQVSPAKVLGTLKTGSQPYSVACYSFRTQSLAFVYRGVVSNLGDSSLVIFDVPTLTITATLQGVPGSRGFHGIASYVDHSGSSGVVAGTDSNIVTALDLGSTPKVLGQLPFSRPTAVFPNYITYSGELSPGTFWATSAQANSLFLFEGNSGTVDKLIQNVPNPQDAIGTTEAPVGSTFAVATNGADSVWWVDSLGKVTLLPGFSQPTSLADVGPVLDGEAVLVTSSSTDSLYVVYVPFGAPSQIGISNAASFAKVQVAPGSLTSGFASTGVSQNFNAASVPLPKTLGGVTLNVGGSFSFDTTTGKWNYSSTGAVQAPLLFVGPNQINFQVPPGIGLGSAVPAQLTKPDGTTLLTTLNITATAPGIFSVLQNGQGQGAVLNQDNTPNGLPIFVGASPAARGSVIQIFATGGGDTTPSLLPGEAAPASGNPLILTNAQPSVEVGNEAAVTFSGMAPGYVGLWQINAVVPQSVTPGNAVPLVINFGSVSSNTVTIAVQ